MDKKWARITTGGSTKQSSIERTRLLDGFNTPRVAVTTLIQAETFCDNIWEPAAGFHKIARVLREYDFDVFTSDIHRWHRDTEVKRDFLECGVLPKRFRKDGCDIITNPPFKLAEEFVYRGMKLLQPGRKLALLLRLQFIESRSRYEMFSKYPPVRIHAYSKRLPRMHQFLYKGPEGGSALAFAWFVFKKGFHGKTEMRWIDPQEHT